MYDVVKEFLQFNHQARGSLSLEHSRRELDTFICSCPRRFGKTWAIDQLCGTDDVIITPKHSMLRLYNSFAFTYQMLDCFYKEEKREKWVDVVFIDEIFMMPNTVDNVIGMVWEVYNPNKIVALGTRG